MFFILHTSNMGPPQLLVLEGSRARYLFDQQLAGDVLHHHGLDVDEFLDAKFRQLPADAGFLDAAKRKARVGPDHLVDGNYAAFDLTRQSYAPLDVVRPYACAKAKLRVVGFPYR